MNQLKTFFLFVCLLICGSTISHADEVKYEGRAVHVERSFKLVNGEVVFTYYTKEGHLSVDVADNKIKLVSSSNVAFLPNPALRNHHYKSHFNNFRDFSARMTWSGFDCWFEKNVTWISTCPLTSAMWAKLYERSFSGTVNRLAVFGETTPSDVLINFNSMISFKGVITDTNKNGEIEVTVDPIAQRIYGTIYFGEKSFGPLVFGYKSYSFDQEYETLSQGMNISFGDNGSGIRLYFYGKDGSEIGGIIHIEKSDNEIPPDIALFGATVNY